MNYRRFAYAAVIVAVLSGCGGNSSITYNSAPVFYSGTVTVANTGYFQPGTAPAIANVVPGQAVTITAWAPPVTLTITDDTSFAVLSSNGVIVKGVLQQTDTPGQISFTFLNGTSSIATGTLTKHSLPTLGPVATVPPPGNYSGTLLIVGNGQARSCGTVSATVFSSGQWQADASEGGGWVGDGIFDGQFLSNGTLASANMINNGSVYVQSNAPQFSFDGKTLIVKYDDLALAPGSCWMTLTAG